MELSIIFYHGEGGIAMINEGLARRIQQGERDLLLQLWEQVQRYAHDRAYKWFRATNGRGGQTVQDLEQEAFLALLEALEGWDKKAGPFLPWYSLRLKAASTAATAQRTQRDRKDPLQDCLSLDAPLTDREGDPFTLEDTILDQRAEDDLEAVEEREKQAAIWRVINSPQTEQRQVILLRYYHHMTREQTAQRLHLTRTSAATIEAKALRLLRHPVNSRVLLAHIKC